MVNEIVVPPIRRAVVPVGAALAAVLVALLVSGHYSGPWWALFPLVTGVALLAGGCWAEGRRGRVADLSARTLIVCGGPTALTGVLLQLSGMADGWPAYPVVAGVSLAAAAWRPVVPGSATDTAIRRVVALWGAVCVLAGLLLAAGVLPVAGVRWWLPIEVVVAAVPLAYGVRLRRGGTAVTLIAFGVLGVLSALSELVQHGPTL